MRFRFKRSNACVRHSGTILGMRTSPHRSEGKLGLDAESNGAVLSVALDGVDVVTARSEVRNVPGHGVLNHVVKSRIEIVLLVVEWNTLPLGVDGDVVDGDGVGDHAQKIELDVLTLGGWVGHAVCVVKVDGEDVEVVIALRPCNWLTGLHPNERLDLGLDDSSDARGVLFVGLAQG